MSLRQAQTLDNDDNLKHKRQDFCLPVGQIYLDGNSLGPLPVAAKQRARDVVEQQWGDSLITSWNRHDWISLPQRIGRRIGEIIGADADEVICADSTSVNLFKLLCSALAAKPGRTRILSEKGNFPTDLYMVQGLQQWLGDKVQFETYEVDELLTQIDDNTAVVMLTQVDFRSGRMLDIEKVTATIHRHGAFALWDLAHSAGAVPLQLSHWQVDLAVGCGYKYLNGGPGAPAFAYVAKRLQTSISQPLTGWMGHANPFNFDPQYAPAAGINSLLVGTPPILSMSVLDAALDVFDDVDMGEIRQKSVALCDAFIQWVEQDERLAELTLASPRDAAIRGSQVAWRHPQAYAICQALIAQGVTADFRAPDILRCGFTPLYLSFEDVWQATQILAEIIAQQSYMQAQFQTRQKVT